MANMLLFLSRAAHGDRADAKRVVVAMQAVQNQMK